MCTTSHALQTPSAAASIGQVHEIVLLDGRKAAMKVLAQHTLPTDPLRLKVLDTDPLRLRVLD